MPTDLRTLTELLQRAANHPEAGVRFVDRRERDDWVPWSEILDRALRVCGSLRGLGVRAGERIALVHPTGREFFDSFFGILLAGAVPVPLYPPNRLGRTDEYRERTARMIALVEARLVLCDRTLKRVLGEAMWSAAPLGCLALDELPERDGVPVAVGAEDLALVQFSSGTTKDPKPVALSHRALVAQTVLLNGFWPDDAGVRHTGVSWLPLYHDMGLVGCVLPALERPSQVTLIRPEVFTGRPAVWLRTISRHRATISPAPSFGYGFCVSRIRDEELDGVDLSSWRVALNGAETVVPSVVRAFQERFARWGFRPEAVTPVYGMSEAALAVTFSDPNRPWVSRRFDRERLAADGRAFETSDGIEIASVGSPLPGFEVRIVDESGDELPPGSVGRVRIKGPSLMNGYLGQPEETERAFPDGWLDSGDLGFRRNGELYLTGRAKDVLLLRGRIHSPEEVERAVDGVQEVRADRVVAVSHLAEEEAGESLLLFVEVGRTTPEGELQSIADRCRDAAVEASGLLPDRVVLLTRGALPRTSSGKLRRRETLRRFLAGELVPRWPAPAESAAPRVGGSSVGAD